MLSRVHQHPDLFAGVTSENSHSDCRYIFTVLGAPEADETYTRRFGLGDALQLGHEGLFGMTEKSRVYSYLRFSDPKQAAGSRADH